MTNIKRFNFRINSDMLDKVRYIANFNGRSVNSQISVWLHDYIDDFERTVQKITDDDLRDAGIIL